MQPIHELPSRILRDEEFAHSEFIIGYYDRRR
ncbi:MAG: RNA repair domain-containing protein [Haliea sp.]